MKIYTFEGKQYIGQNAMFELVTRYIPKLSNSTFIKYRKQKVFEADRYEHMYIMNRIYPFWFYKGRKKRAKQIADAIISARVRKT